GVRLRWACRGCRPEAAAVIVIVVGRSAAGAVGGGGDGVGPGLARFLGRGRGGGGGGGRVGGGRRWRGAGAGGAGGRKGARGGVAGWFADGVWLAELAAVRDPAQVPAVVAAVLGVGERPGEPAAEAVARVLAGQQLLLVLDNCEHLIGAAAGLCAGLLPRADDVRVLATSREPLAVAGEARYRLAPLIFSSARCQPGRPLLC